MTPAEIARRRNREWNLLEREEMTRQRAAATYRFCSGREMPPYKASLRPAGIVVWVVAGLMLAYVLYRLICGILD